MRGLKGHSRYWTWMLDVNESMDGEDEWMVIGDE